MTPIDYWRASFESAGAVLVEADRVLADVEGLRHTCPDDYLEAVAAVTPCSCSAQRARAEAAEAKLDAVREFCLERTEGYADDPFDYVLQFALDVLAVLDGEETT